LRSENRNKRAQTLAKKGGKKEKKKGAKKRRTNKVREDEV
jgi:hypothetical protein